MTTMQHRPAPLRRLEGAKRYFCGRGAPSRARLNVFGSSSTTAPKGSPIIETRHLLPDGVGLEMVVQKAAQENFLPYFSSKGYDCYAVSMRAQGKSDPVFTNVAGTLEGHANDLADLVDALKRQPVLITHSISGLIAQKGFAAKSFTTNIDDCRSLFFSADLEMDKLQRYQQLLAENGPVRLMDLQDINRQVPLPPPPAHRPPTLVLGAEDDMCVDVEAVQELAQYYGVQPVIIRNMAHDCMLDTRWEDAAAAVVAWLDTIPAN